jgi:hypothetical protein
MELGRPCCGSFDPNGTIARLSALPLARSASGFHLLNRLPILIVEDELFIALELQALVEDAGGQVVGPVGSANAALTLLQTCVVGAAILDVCVRGGVTITLRQTCRRT